MSAEENAHLILPDWTLQFYTEYQAGKNLEGIPTKLFSVNF